MIEIYLNLRDKANALRDIPPLFFRLVLSYGFYEPAMKKLGNIESVSQWFGSMGYPFPTLNAYLAGITEGLGFILLLIGLGTRIISVPLMFVMLVAIFTVHIGNGYTAGNNGFEIPFYYLLMLFSLLITGPGRISVDAIFDKKYRKK